MASKKDQTLDEYLGSEQYTKDVAKVAAKFNKVNWGGFTTSGYTKHTTITGEVISIPVNAKSK